LKDPEAERERIRAIADGGATWWGECVPAAGRKTMRAAVARGPITLD
jgi:hypothetical protein